MNVNPILTIGIPAFDRIPLLLDRCADLQSESVRNNCRITLSDDSEGSSLESLKALGIGYLRHEATGNAVDNWNYLLDASTSRWTWILHHDEFVYNVEAVIDECRKADRLGCDVIIFNTQVVRGDSELAAGSRLLKRLCVIFPRLLWCINPIGSPSAICVRQHKYRTYRTDLKWLVDVENFGAIFKSTSKTLFSDIKLYSVVDESSSITSSIADIYSLHVQELEECEKRYPVKLLIKIFLRFRYKN